MGDRKNDDDPAARSVWVNSAGEIAHPDSPRGAGGPGKFRSPGAHGTHDDAWGLPHPQSHSGRHLLHGHVAAAVSAHPTKTAKSQTTVEPVRLLEFNIQKGKLVKDITGMVLGVHPPNWGGILLNAVELIFAVDLVLARKRGISRYRCRQKVAFQELWERQLKDGKETPWQKTMADGEAPDDPAEGLQTTAPPSIAFFDSPGFMGMATSVQLKGPQGKETDKLAVAVFLRQNFVAWIDGLCRSGRKTTWQRVSAEVKWHSNQSLARSPLFNHDWYKVGGTEIALGHTKGAPPTR